MNAQTKRIVLVDGSAIARRRLAGLLRDGLKGAVVETAATSAIALRRLEAGNVDLTVLDVEMPDEDGIAAVGLLRERWPRVPLLVCSKATTPGSATTLQALEKGATDCVLKPADQDSDAFRSTLLGKVGRLLGTAVVARTPAQAPAAAISPVVRALAAARKSKIDIVGIGSSTGGPDALAAVFEGLAHPLPVPIVIVQHMPPMFTGLLAQRLATVSKLPVKEGEHGEALEAGTTYIAPGGKHMVVLKDAAGVRLALNEEPPECSCRPAVDVMFRSLARVFGPSVFGVVLTGMGHDGTEGARHLVDGGASVVVQDPASCVVPSMPSSVWNAGLAQKTVPLLEIPTEMHSRAAFRRHAMPSLQRMISP